MYKKGEKCKNIFCLGGMRVDEQEIQRLVEEVSLQYFEVPFLHKAVFNNRLRTTGGRYLLKSHNIELNYRYYEVYGEEELVGIIKHELCHYHLHIAGRGYKHMPINLRFLLPQVQKTLFFLNNL